MKPANLRALARDGTAARWALAVAVAIISAIGLVLLFMLMQTTNNRELYERHYQWLLVVNIVVAVTLAAVIVWIAVRLALRLKQGRFGSRLLVKLAAIFALVGVFPGLLIYTVSYQFVSRSIESWFDVKVEGALDAGLSLGRATLDTLSTDLGNKTRQAAIQLSEAAEGVPGLSLERLREQLGATDVVLWGPGGQALASSGASRFDLSPERPSPAMLRAARTQRVVTVVEGLDDTSGGSQQAINNTRVRALASVPTSNFGLGAEQRYLQVTVMVPPTLVANAISVQEANREYQERALARQGLRRMYIGTLTLSLFLAVFGSVVLAVLLGNQLARPLLVLAEGVRQVAEGDLTPKAALTTRDELGGLTRSFANMTQQLADARAAVQVSMDQVDAARANLQTILDNLTSGVIVLSPQGLVESSNPGATRILRAPLASVEGMPIQQVAGLESFGQAVVDWFVSYLDERALHGLDHWQQAYDLQVHELEPVNLVIRGAELPGGQWLVVIDDISEIVSAQRAQAWGEVARRLAHEIKNPLTPIQLSAERLGHKLIDKLAGQDQALLVRSVKMIVDQVDSMKRLVNEFRDYARLPVADLKLVDLNALVADILSLYSVDADAGLVRCELDPDCPPIRADAQQVRQVIHNLIQNAQDATEGRSAREVTVRTKLVRAGDGAATRVRLSVSDNGPGFAEHILKRAFEPYVTTKVRGTGLGLAVVKKIADEHGARVDLSNRTSDGVVKGAQVSLSFAVANWQQ